MCFGLVLELEHVLLSNVPGGIADQGSGKLLGDIVGVMVIDHCSANFADNADKVSSKSLTQLTIYFLFTEGVTSAVLDIFQCILQHS